MDRPKCKCGNYAAINYKKNGKTYYRKKCHRCIVASKKPTKKDWELAGYIKENYCEKCGFKAKYIEQITVVKTRGALPTYKSVCLNCEVELNIIGGWKAGDLTPDF